MPIHGNFLGPIFEKASFEARLEQSPKKSRQSECQLLLKATIHSS
jgi:hypothetical protein